MGRWWRDKSLANSMTLKSRGSRLVSAKAERKKFAALAKQVGARRLLEPQYGGDIVARDTAIKRTLKEGGIDAESNGSLLFFEPWEVTEINRAVQSIHPVLERLQPHGETGLWNVPDKITAPAQWPQSDALPAQHRLTIWTASIYGSEGEDGARDALALFLAQNIAGYAERRNLPAEPATSRLSPHLRWGEISPARIVAETEAQISKPMTQISL